MVTLKGGKVLNGNFAIEDTNVVIDGELIKSVDSVNECGEVIDCSNCYVIPGLIDIHTHGAKGADNMDVSYDAINTISKFMGDEGVTTYLATLITQSYENMSAAAANIKAAKDKGVDGAKIGGIYMEGPYFSSKYKGAQNEEFLRNPSVKEFNEINSASGNIIKVVSMAPELEGAMDFIKEVKDNVTVSIGHTDSDYETAKEAIANGANNMTHTFNGMRGLHHRNPNAIGAAFESDITCECICDGMHINGTIINLMYKIIGEDRMVLISDSLRSTGMADGVYDLGGQETIVKDGKATLKDGTIAGSTATLLGCVKKAVEFGIPFANAVKMASINPAKVARIDSEVGSIEVGKKADMLILDEKLNLKKVIINGKVK